MRWAALCSFPLALGNHWGTLANCPDAVRQRSMCFTWTWEGGERTADGDMILSPNKKKSSEALTCLQSRSNHADISMFYSTHQWLFDTADAVKLKTKIYFLFYVFCTAYACLQCHVKAFMGHRLTHLWALKFPKFCLFFMKDVPSRGSAERAASTREGQQLKTCSVHFFSQLGDECCLDLLTEGSQSDSTWEQGLLHLKTQRRCVFNYLSVWLNYAEK